jgi:hypothetical protein
MPLCKHSGFATCGANQESEPALHRSDLQHLRVLLIWQRHLRPWQYEPTSTLKRGWLLAMR